MQIHSDAINVLFFGDMWVSKGDNNPTVARASTRHEERGTKVYQTLPKMPGYFLARGRKNILSLLGHTLPRILIEHRPSYFALDAGL